VEDRQTPSTTSGKPSGTRPPTGASITIITLATLEEASTHKSAKTHAGNVFVTPDLDLLTPNGFSRLIVEHLEHLCVKFGDPSCIDFVDIVRKKRQTHTHTDRHTHRETERQTDGRRQRPYRRRG